MQNKNNQLVFSKLRESFVKNKKLSQGVLSDIIKEHSFFDNQKSFLIETSIYLHDILSETNNIDTVIAKAQKCLDTEYTTFQIVVVIAGIDCSKTIQLDNATWLIPLNQVTKSRQLDEFNQSSDALKTNALFQHPHSGFMPSILATQNMPRAALIKEVSNNPIKWPPKEQRQQLYAHHEGLRDELYEFVLFLGCLENATPYIESSWLQTGDEELNKWRKKWTSMSDKLTNKPFIPTRPLNSTKVSEGDVQKLWQEFIALKPKLKSQLLVALDLINTARLFKHPEEQVLHTAIALESLLLGADERTGIAKHFKNRARDLLDLSAKEAKYFYNFYKYRSQLVHNGEYNPIAPEKWAEKFNDRNDGFVFVQKKTTEIIRHFMRENPERIGWARESRWGLLSNSLIQKIKITRRTT